MNKLLLLSFLLSTHVQLIAAYELFIAAYAYELFIAAHSCS